MKLKTRKSVLKRIKVNKNFLFHKKAYKGHLLRKKNSKHLHRLSLINIIHKSDIKNFYTMLPYIFYLNY
jgi:ribosomal protein L35